MDMAVSVSVYCAHLYESVHRSAIRIVAINELSDIDTIAYLTRYDTTHGRFPLEDLQ